MNHGSGVANSEKYFAKIKLFENKKNENNNKFVPPLPKKSTPKKSTPQKPKKSPQKNGSGDKKKSREIPIKIENCELNKMEDSPGAKSCDFLGVDFFGRGGTNLLLFSFFFILKKFDFGEIFLGIGHSGSMIHSYPIFPSGK